MIRRPNSFAIVLVFTLVIAQGCALRFQTPVKSQPVALTPEPPESSKHAESVAANHDSSKKECPDRVDGARVGSLTGTVLGTIVGAAFGMPWLGIVYKFAGSAIGFATGNPCGQKVVPKKNGKWVKPVNPTPQENGEQDEKTNGAVEPVLQPNDGIKEENI